MVLFQKKSVRSKFYDYKFNINNGINFYKWIQTDMHKIPCSLQAAT